MFDLPQQEGPGLNTLIVVTDSPLLWRSASSASAAAVPAEYRRQGASTPRTTGEEDCRHQADGWRTHQDSGGEGVTYFNRCRYEELTKKNAKRSPFSSKSGPRSRAASSWSGHPREAVYLLSLLFSWAATVKNDDDGLAKTEPSATDVATQAMKSNFAASNGRGFASKASSPVQRRIPHATAREGERVPNRSFCIVCPATRTGMNIETYVKDSETGRVAVQWCLASKDSGETGDVVELRHRMCTPQHHGFRRFRSYEICARGRARTWRTLIDFPISRLGLESNVCCSCKW